MFAKQQKEKNTQKLEKITHKFEINAAEAPTSSFSQKIPLILFIPEIHNISLTFLTLSSPSSSVGITTDYGLDGTGIESRGSRVSAPLQIGLRGPPSLLYNGYRVFPGGKERPGRDADPF